MASGVYIRTKENLKNLSIAQKAVGRTTVPANCKNTGRTRFKKGMAPWNKGLEGYMAGEDSPNWKGDDVGNDALHSWAKRRLVKPNICEHCYQIKPLDLANKSREYKRDLNDWLWLCRSCHAKYDDYVNKSWITRRRVAK